MKPATIVGIVLIVLGVVSFVFGGFTVTRDKKILDIGPIEAHKEVKERFPIPTVLGGLVLVGGIVLVIVGSRKD